MRTRLVPLFSLTAALITFAGCAEEKSVFPFPAPGAPGESMVRIDGSTNLECPEVRDAYGEDGNPLNEESMKRVGHAWSASAQRLKAAGIDLAGYILSECGHIGQAPGQ